MDTRAIVGILSELLSGEQRSLATRLTQSTPFVSHLSLADVGVVARLARASEAHCAQLADLILELGGVPGPRTCDPTSADLHFQELHHILPRLIADHEALIRKYELAAQRVAAQPRAASLVERILSDHREGRSILQQPRRRNVRTTSH